MTGEKTVRKSGRGGVGLLVAALVIGVVFGTGPLVRYLKAPAISEGFGLEEAVVALRLDARDTSYLVLVDEEGETRSVRLEERGFENSRLVWTAGVLSTGGPRDEYVLHRDGLAKLPLSDSPPAPSEQLRLATDAGVTVFTSSVDSAQAAFIDPAADRLTVVDAGYTTPAMASCGDAVVMVGENGVEEVIPETRDFDRLGLFDDVEQLACDGDLVYGLGGISHEAKPREALRVWSRAGGGPREVEVRYPEAVNGTPANPFVHNGRLTWTADWKMWSVEAPDAEASEAGAADDGMPDPDNATSGGSTESPVVEAVEVAELGGPVGTDDPFEYHPVVGIDSGALAISAGRAYSVAADEERIERRRGGSYDRLNGMAIFSVDARTGERRVEVEIESDDIDFPRRDLHVHAIAVDPEWAAGR